MFSQIKIPHLQSLSRKKIFVFIFLFVIVLILLFFVVKQKPQSPTTTPRENTPTITKKQIDARPTVADAGNQLTFSYNKQTTVMTLIKKDSGSGLPPIPGTPRDEKNMLNFRVDASQNGKVTSTQWITVPDESNNNISFTVNLPTAYTDAIHIVNRQEVTMYEGKL